MNLKIEGNKRRTLGNEDNFCYYDDDVHIASHIEQSSKDLLNKLKEKYN